jgi:hypothetical protein
VSTPTPTPSPTPAPSLTPVAVAPQQIALTFAPAAIGEITAPGLESGSGPALFAVFVVVELPSTSTSGPDQQTVVGILLLVLGALFLLWGFLLRRFPGIYSSETERSRSEFVTTVTLERAIAPAASTGDSSHPVSG